ncbi:hypothetical protein AD941_09690 [Gluconobacter albidus]|uniref:Transposase n=1 Tax=Gluconobacter albidus TaxID=318683 RepID=A0AAW3QY13_9PROT|nr:hypothetical protein AD941_09690 [Gluconobacter albidus]
MIGVLLFFQIHGWRVIKQPFSLSKNGRLWSPKEFWQMKTYRHYLMICPIFRRYLQLDSNIQEINIRKLDILALTSI